MNGMQSQFVALLGVATLAAPVLGQKQQRPDV